MSSSSWLNPWTVGGAAVALGSGVALALAALLGQDEVPAEGQGVEGHRAGGTNAGGLPKGKGIFVRSVSQGGGPSLFADRMEYLGMDWVMVQSMFHDRNGRHINDQSRYAAYAAELERVGCTPWVWGWPRPESDQQFVDVSMEAIEKLGARGLVVNAESAYLGDDGAENATRLIDLCREGLGEFPLGLTTYGGGPKWHPSFPWEVFSSVDFTLPQFYDLKQNLGPDYPREALQRYAEAGYRNFIPVWAASDRYDIDRMQTMADRTPLPHGAVCFWDLYWLLRGEDRIEWVRNFRIPEQGAVA